MPLPKQGKSDLICTIKYNDSVSVLDIFYSMISIDTSGNCTISPRSLGVHCNLKHIIAKSLPQTNNCYQWFAALEYYRISIPQTQNFEL